MKTISLREASEYAETVAQGIFGFLDVFGGKAIYLYPERPTLQEFDSSRIVMLEEDALSDLPTS